MASLSITLATTRLNPRCVHFEVSSMRVGPYVSGGPSTWSQLFCLCCCFYLDHETTCFNARDVQRWSCYIWNVSGFITLGLQFILRTLLLCIHGIKLQLYESLRWPNAIGVRPSACVRGALIIEHSYFILKTASPISIVIVCIGGGDVRGT